ITSSRLFFTLLRPPTSTLFPYTTLFRSRNSYAGQWQNRRSVWTWTAAFLALASMVGICVYRYAEVWTPLERFYVTTYIRSVLRRSEEHTSELQSRSDLVCRLLLEKKKNK